MQLNWSSKTLAEKNPLTRLKIQRNRIGTESPQQQLARLASRRLEERMRVVCSTLSVLLFQGLLEPHGCPGLKEVPRCSAS